MLILESPRAGRTVQSRLIGVQKGVEERFGVLSSKAVHHLDGGGDRPTAKATLEEFLSQRSNRRVLVAGINDESAIGAAEAAEAKQYQNIAIVGHGGSSEIAEIIADPQSACIGTVSFRPDLYGPGLVSFGMPILQGRSTAPVHYVRHEFMSKKSLARLQQESSAH